MWIRFKIEISDSNVFEDSKGKFGGGEVAVDYDAHENHIHAST